MSQERLTLTPQRQGRAMAVFNGMLRLWCYDVGCVSFLGAGLMGLVIGIVVAWLGEPTSFAMMMSMTISSAAAAVAWQFVRLSASESLLLIPRYRQHIVGQCVVVMVTIISLCVLLTLGFGFTLAIESLLLATAIGVGFIGLCVTRPQWFFASFLLFVLTPFLPMLVEYVAWWLSLIALVSGIGWLVRQLSPLSWRFEARSVYLNGMEMGWFWLPNIQARGMLSRLERYLYPCNFFIGPMLTLLLLLLPALTLTLGIVSYGLDWRLDALQLMVQCYVILCSLVHWSRVQRSRATETLLLMPGFDGRQGLINAFAGAQQRLLNLIVLSVLICILCLGWLNRNLDSPALLHLVLSTYWACAWVLGLGCMCRRVLHITLTMLVVVVHSLFFSISLASLRDGGNVEVWLISDVVLLLFGQIVLLWGKKRLWCSDDLS